MDIKFDNNMNSPIVWVSPNNVTILLLMILFYTKTPQQYYSCIKYTMQYIYTSSPWQKKLDTIHNYVSMQAQEM